MSQGFVVTVADYGSIALPLRLPNAFPGEYTVIPGLWFAYGHDASVAAIGRNLSDKWVSMVLGTVS